VAGVEDHVVELEVVVDQRWRALGGSVRLLALDIAGGFEEVMRGTWAAELNLGMTPATFTGAR